MPDFRRKNNNFNAINQNIHKPNTGSNLSDMQHMPHKILEMRRGFRRRISGEENPDLVVLLRMKCGLNAAYKLGL